MWTMQTGKRTPGAMARMKSEVLMSLWTMPLGRPLLPVQEVEKTWKRLRRSEEEEEEGMKLKAVVVDDEVVDDDDCLPP
jgi:hypothetical protein